MNESMSQLALLAMAEHAAVAPDLLSCLESRNYSSTSNALCFNDCLIGLDQILSMRYDTTGSLALRAYDAMSTGRYTGRRSTLSYMGLRNMQEEKSFINREEGTGAPFAPWRLQMLSCVHQSTSRSTLTTATDYEYASISSDK
jgi:hypothetical protein